MFTLDCIPLIKNKHVMDILYHLSCTKANIRPKQLNHFEKIKSQWVLTKAKSYGADIIFTFIGKTKSNINPRK